MITAESRLQNTTAVFSEGKHYPFPDIEIYHKQVKDERVGELEEEKLPKLKSKNRKVAHCCRAEMNWTVKPLVFMIPHWRFILLALVFGRFSWRRAVTIAVVDCCVDIHRTSSQEQTKPMVTGSFGNQWLDCWICNAFQWAMAWFIYVFIQDFAEFVLLGQQQLFHCFCNSFLWGLMCEHHMSFALLNEIFLTWFHLFSTDLFDFTNSKHYSCRPHGSWVNRYWLIVLLSSRNNC